MTTSIKELSALNREDALLRSAERIVDRAVQDYKLERAVEVLWVMAESQQTQMSFDEMDKVMTEAVLGEVK
jgi:hypothetical protein